MIPAFPKFKKLEVSDRTEVEAITSLLPPYSDYNFVSLWSWDTEGDLDISVLNGNLVIKMPDYVTTELFYSFIGTNLVDETINTLISFAEKTGVDTTLKLIPNSVVEHIKNNSLYIIEEDRDSFDYVIDLVDFVNLEGTRNRTKRGEINRYKRNHEDSSTIKRLDLTKENTKNEILALFKIWEKTRGRDSKETKNELDAIKKLIRHSQHFNLEALGLYIYGEMKGFSIYEVLHDNHAIGHFEKADTSYNGIAQYMRHHALHNLLNFNVKYFNEEQDLGIEGLRNSKLLHRPSHFMKKYTIRLKKTS